eukprot:TRINITY_DN60966_c0_g1_i1.p1 TRINITY_DN60966_c0_g1~~TRINITY_DN60966_c0_g1_i1.p1  ORF type:complete len:657 (-),score=101.24 TRINITY_DN60966_c0_g1_i1:174-2144(-)
MVRLSALLLTVGAAAIDYGPLSPGLWSSAELAQVNKLFNARGPRPMATSSGGMIAGSSSALAIHIGRTALAQGGNAVDAAVATAMAQATVVANEYVSWAGTADIVFWNASSRTLHGVQGGWTIPKAADAQQVRPYNEPYSGQDGPYPVGASVPVPGFVRGLEAALARHGSGKFGWDDIVGASHYLAAEGFIPSPLLLYAPRLKSSMKALNRTKAGRDLSAKLLATRPGEALTQPELAGLLGKLRSDGSAAMYEGEFAKKAVELMQSWGSAVTLQDFAGYAPQFTEPVTVPSAVGGKPIATGAVGAGNLAEILLLFDVAGFGASPRYDAVDGGEALTAIVAFGRWGVYVGSLAQVPNGRKYLNYKFPGIFSQGAVVSYEALSAYRATRAYADAVWEHFKQNITEMQSQIDALVPSDARRTTHSDAVVSIDAQGNAVAMVHTINSSPWGSGLIVDGVALSDALSVHQFWIKHNGVQGAYGMPQLVPNELMPCLVLDGSAEPAVEAAVSVISDSLKEVTPQMLWRIVLYGDSPEKAVNGAHLKLGDKRAGSQAYQRLAVEDNCATLGTEPLRQHCTNHMPMLNAFPTEVISSFSSNLRRYIEIASASDSDPGDSVGNGHSGMPAIITRDIGGRLSGCSTPVANGGAEGVDVPVAGATLV